MSGIILTTKARVYQGICSLNRNPSKWTQTRYVHSETKALFEKIKKNNNKILSFKDFQNKYTFSYDDYKNEMIPKAQMIIVNKRLDQTEAGKITSDSYIKDRFLKHVEASYYRYLRENDPDYSPTNPWII